MQSKPPASTCTECAHRVFTGRPIYECTSRQGDFIPVELTTGNAPGSWLILVLDCDACQERSQQMPWRRFRYAEEPAGLGRLRAISGDCVLEIVPKEPGRAAWRRSRCRLKVHAAWATGLPYGGSSMGKHSAGTYYPQRFAEVGC